MVKLFVGGFPLDIEEIELVKLFSPHGEVSTIKIVRDKKTRKCKGYAFLEITDQAGADRAIEVLDGSPIGDRVLSVKQVEEKPVPAAPKYTSTKKTDVEVPRFTYARIGKPAEPLKKKRPRRP